MLEPTSRERLSSDIPQRPERPFWVWVERTQCSFLDLFINALIKKLHEALLRVYGLFLVLPAAGNDVFNRRWCQTLQAGECLKVQAW